MAIVRGYVFDTNNAPVANCVVRAYRRDNGGFLVQTTTSDGTTQLGDPRWSNRSLLLPFDFKTTNTAFIDEGPNKFTVQRQGSLTISTVAPKYGTGAASFDGTDDALFIARSAAFDFGAGDFSIELHLKPTVLPGNHLLCTNRATSASDPGVYFAHTGAQVGFQAWGPSAGTVLFSGTSPACLVANQYQYLAVARQGSTFRIVHNTTVVFEGSAVGAIAPTSTESLFIGRDPSVTTRYFAGDIDDLRITKGYAEGFTPGATVPGPFPTFAQQPLMPVGMYYIDTGTYQGDVHVIALDPDTGSAENDLILRVAAV